MTTREPEAGTVSHGTMQPRDLLPNFASTLRELSNESDDHKLAEEADSLADKLGRPEVSDALLEEADNVLEELFDRLDDLAGEGMYFGAHEGDGSDYGFWSIDEEEE